MNEREKKTKNRFPLFVPIDVYTMLSGYDEYDKPGPIGVGEWLERYGGGLALLCIYEPLPLELLN